MIDSILGSVEGFMRSLPVQAVATIAVVVGGGGLILSGWRYLVNGILGLFDAFATIINAIGVFFRTILLAFGTALGGLIILGLGGVAIWWGLILLKGG